jgi:hypothetical protein
MGGTRWGKRKPLRSGECGGLLVFRLPAKLTWIVAQLFCWLENISLKSYINLASRFQERMEALSMFKFRLFVVVLLPVLAITALAASSATGAEFSTSSVPANSSGPTAEVIPVTKNFVFDASGVATVSCPTVRAIGGVVVNDTNKASIKSIHFSNCTDETEPTKCAISTVETKPVTITLEDTVEGKTVENIKPETGTEITKVIVKNKGSENCEAAISTTIRGLVVSEPENNSTATTHHPYSVSISASSQLLIYAEKPFSWSGAAELSLKSGATFSLLA